jgi:hypothetical protein
VEENGCQYKENNKQDNGDQSRTKKESDWRGIEIGYINKEWHEDGYENDQYDVGKEGF